MRKWHPAVLLVLTATASVAGYFALQVLAVFVAFFRYGTSTRGSEKWVNVSALFLVLQLAVVSYIFYRKGWPNKIPALLLALFIPPGPFLALDGSGLLPK
jgi:hypothetical protein